jgi:hypothetical protein
MTNKYITKEDFEEKVKKDKKVIEDVNEGRITFEEAEEKLKEIWN